MNHVASCPPSSSPTSPMGPLVMGSQEALKHATIALQSSGTMLRRYLTRTVPILILAVLASVGYGVVYREETAVAQEYSFLLPLIEDVMLRSSTAASHTVVLQLVVILPTVVFLTWCTDCTMAIGSSNLVTVPCGPNPIETTYMVTNGTTYVLENCITSIVFTTAAPRATLSNVRFQQDGGTALPIFSLDVDALSNCSIDISRASVHGAHNNKSMIAILFNRLSDVQVRLAGLVLTDTVFRSLVWLAAHSDDGGVVGGVAHRIDVTAYNVVMASSVLNRSVVYVRCNATDALHVHFIRGGYDIAIDKDDVSINMASSLARLHLFYATNLSVVARECTATVLCCFNISKCAPNARAAFVCSVLFLEVGRHADTVSGTVDSVTWNVTSGSGQRTSVSVALLRLIGFGIQTSTSLQVINTSMVARASASVYGVACTSMTDVRDLNVTVRQSTFALYCVGFEVSDDRNVVVIQVGRFGTLTTGRFSVTNSQATLRGLSGNNELDSKLLSAVAVVFGFALVTGSTRDLTIELVRVVVDCELRNGTLGRQVVSEVPYITVGVNAVMSALVAMPSGMSMETVGIAIVNCSASANLELQFSPFGPESLLNLFAISAALLAIPTNCSLCTITISGSALYLQHVLIVGPVPVGSSPEDCFGGVLGISTASAVQSFDASGILAYCTRSVPGGIPPALRVLVNPSYHIGLNARVDNTSLRIAEGQLSALSVSLFAAPSFVIGGSLLFTQSQLVMNASATMSSPEISSDSTAYRWVSLLSGAGSQVQHVDIKAEHTFNFAHILSTRLSDSKVIGCLIQLKDSLFVGDGTPLVVGVPPGRMEFSSASSKIEMEGCVVRRTPSLLDGSLILYPTAPLLVDVGCITWGSRPLVPSRWLSEGIVGVDDGSVELNTSGACTATVSLIPPLPPAVNPWQPIAAVVDAVGAGLVVSSAVASSLPMLSIGTSLPWTQSAISIIRITRICTDGSDAHDVGHTPSLLLDDALGDEDDRFGSQLLDNPMQLKLGGADAAISLAIGALVGNVLVMVMVGTASATFSAVLGAYTSATLAEPEHAGTKHPPVVFLKRMLGEGRAVLPGAFAGGYATLVQPCATAAMVLVCSSSGGRGVVFLGVCGLVAMGAPVVLISVTLLRRRPFPLSRQTIFTGSALQRAQKQSEPLLFRKLHRLTEGSSAWVASVGGGRKRRSDAMLLLRRFGPFFDMYRNGMHWYVVIDYTCMFVCGFVCGVAEGLRTCSAALGAAIVLMLIASGLSLFVAVRRPYETKADVAFALATQMISVASLISSVAGAETVASAIGIVQALFVLGVVVFIRLLWYAWKTWSRFRSAAQGVFQRLGDVAQLGASGLASIKLSYEQRAKGSTRRHASKRSGASLRPRVVTESDASLSVPAVAVAHASPEQLANLHCLVEWICAPHTQTSS